MKKFIVRVLVYIIFHCWKICHKNTYWAAIYGTAYLDSAGLTENEREVLLIMFYRYYNKIKKPPINLQVLENKIN